MHKNPENYKRQYMLLKAMKKAFILFILLFFLISCTQQSTEDIQITTADGITLHALYNEAETDKAVLLLHMVGEDATVYEDLALFLQEHDFTVLRLDFRGHGKSDLNYETFTDADWQNLLLDVEAGVDFLEEQGYERIGIVGASIGANAAIKHAVQDTRIDSLILISAGEDYHGLTTVEFAAYYTNPILVIASLDDKDAAIAATKIYNAAATEYKDIEMFQTGGHGTALLIQPSLPNTIGEWLFYSY